MVSALNAALSLKETAVLSGAPEKSIRHELAARVVRASRSGGRRLFSLREVVYFFLVNELPAGLGLDRKLVQRATAAMSLGPNAPWGTPVGKLARVLAPNSQPNSCSS